MIATQGTLKRVVITDKKRISYHCIGMVSLCANPYKKAVTKRE
jgi:hypothetical protein